MQPTFVMQPAVRLVGLEIRTRAMSPEIPAPWPRFVARLPEIAGVAEPGTPFGAMRHASGNVRAGPERAHAGLRDGHRRTTSAAIAAPAASSITPGQPD